MTEIRDDEQPLRETKPEWWKRPEAQTRVVLQFPANQTEVRFMGLRVFLESTGEQTRDERNVKRFNERIAKLQREWENTILGVPRVS